MSWCARPIPLDRNGSVIRPLVLGPRTLPRVTDIERAHALPELAVLSAVAHGTEHDAAEIAAVGLDACSGLDSRRATRYADYIMASLNEAARRSLETLMNRPNYEYQSDFARKYFGQGEVNALRRTLLKQLSQRFEDIPDVDRRRIEEADREQLEQWLDRVFPATSLAAVFHSE